MNDQSKVTFVIPVRNRKEYLKEALVSLQNQTLPNWLCIVVDDFSEDNIEKVVSEIADERITYCKNIYSPGVSGARNTGNERVTTEWIAVADSDDINLPRRLAVSLDYLERYPKTDVLYSNLYTFRDGSYEINQWRHSDRYERKKLYDHNFIANNTTMYRKEAVIKLGGYDESLVSAEDYELWLKFANQHAVFTYIEEPLALYRRHGEQFSSKEERDFMRENAEKAKSKHRVFL